MRRSFQVIMATLIIAAALLPGLSTFGQAPAADASAGGLQTEKPQFVDVVPASGKPEEPVSHVEDSTILQTVVRRPQTPKTQDVTPGADGDVFLSNPPAPYGSAGIFLRANTNALPNIAARLGLSTTAAQFEVRDSNDSVLFLARAGDGRFGVGEITPAQALHVTKNQNAGTGIRITNGNTGAAAYTTIGFTESASVKAEINSVGSGYNAVGGPNTLQIWNYANAPMVFGTNSTEAMRIQSDGGVNIGATSISGAKLAVVDTRFATGTPFFLFKQSSVATNKTDNDFTSFFRAYETVSPGIANSGGLIGIHNEAFNTGAGTIANVYGERVYAGVLAGITGTVTNAYGTRIYVQSGGGAVTNGYGVYLENVAGTSKAYGIYQVGADDKNYFSGNVGIGTDNPTQKLHVVGDATFVGTITGTNIKAQYQDFAEWVPAAEDMPPGTVVVLDRSAINQVMPSSTAYDTSVAGVVSAAPGVLLGVPGDAKEQIATTGRVKVRVDASAGPIAIGDLLVTSDRPGYAMRSAPIEVGGAFMHRPGTIVGKALEPLALGQGEILVLLSLQ